MTLFLNNKKKSSLIELASDSNKNVKDIPLDMSDLLNLCQEFANLGWQIQHQIEMIWELGVDQAIMSGILTKESLPHIKHFFSRICQNPYFGDSALQAEEYLKAISSLEEDNTVDTFNN